MDPDQNLYDVLKEARDVLENPDHNSDTALRLAELVLGLHEWLTRGGAKPKEWQHE